MNNFKNYANSFQTVINLRLDRVLKLLSFLKSPQNGMKYIQVAGTNAKGSVCAFLQTALTKSGRRTGKYISPNLIKVNERITVDNEEISDSDLNRLLGIIEKEADRVYDEIGEHPTQFEIWTAIAFMYFKEKNCDIVILETGLGGRFDATNVVSENVMSIITRIDLDHTEYLGDTLSKIAFEKCGIIKKNAVTVTANQEASALAVIKERTKEENSRLIIAPDVPKTDKKHIYEKYVYNGEEIFLGLGGIHQLENASIAVSALEALGVPKDCIAYGLKNAKNPARFELLEEEPPVIFDGGHNPNGVGSLIKSLERYYEGEKAVFICAFMKDKDIEGCLKLIKEKAKEILFVCVENNERSAKKEQLTEIADKLGIKNSFFGDVKDALSYAKKERCLTVICGSLYLYKDIKKV